MTGFARGIAGRAVDVIALGLGAAVLGPTFRHLAAARPDLLARVRHELFAARGGEFVSEVGAVEKAAFVAKMLGSDGGFARSSAGPQPPARRQPAGVAELLFAGDLLAAEGLGARSLSDALRARIAEASCFVVNIEGTVSTESHAIAPFLTRRGLAQLARYARDPDDGGWSSRHDVDELRAVFAGLPRVVASVANNHTLDDGLDGFDRTLALLRGLGHEIVGDARTDEGVVAIGVGAHRVGMFALTYGSNRRAGADGCHLQFDDVPHRIARDRAARLVDRLRDRGATHVVALLHWGHEHEHEPTRAQESCARLLGDAGVSAIIGHHPHLLQRTDHARPPWVSYSLGDFVGGDRTIWSRFGSMVALRFGPDGAVSGELIPTVQAPFWEAQRTMLLCEAPPLERAVFARFFASKLARGSCTSPTPRARRDQREAAS